MTDLTERFKNETRYITNKLVKKGSIKKGACSVCGDIKAECHHKNYLDPKDIIWLCKKHHAEIHRKIPKEWTESIMVKCTAEYKESVKKMAVSRGMSISEFIRFLIEKQKESDRR